MRFRLRLKSFKPFRQKVSRKLEESRRRGASITAREPQLSPSFEPPEFVTPGRPNDRSLPMGSMRRAMWISIRALAVFLGLASPLSATFLTSVNVLRISYEA